jgi:hypothetical protein
MTTPATATITKACFQTFCNKARPITARNKPMRGSMSAVRGLFIDYLILSGDDLKVLDKGIEVFAAKYCFPIILLLSAD